MNDVKKIVGYNIKKHRLANNISQEKLAELSDLHRTYISSVELGKRNISIENIHRISLALKINPILLLEGLNELPRY